MTRSKRIIAFGILVACAGCYTSRTAPVDGSPGPVDPPRSDAGPLPGPEPGPEPGPDPDPIPQPAPGDAVQEYFEAINAVGRLLCECFPGFPEDLEECLEVNTVGEEVQACAAEAYASYPEETVREGLNCLTQATLSLRRCLDMTMCDEEGFDACGSSYEGTASECASIGRTAELFEDFDRCQEFEEEEP